MRNKRVSGIFLKTDNSLVAALERKTFQFFLKLGLDRSIKGKSIGIQENADTL